MTKERDKLGTWGLNIAIVLAVGVMGAFSWTRATQAEDALCALRHDLELRVERSEQYLEAVEAGTRKPIPGITKADITTSIHNQRDTIEALSNLDCPEPKEKNEKSA